MQMELMKVCSFTCARHTFERQNHHFCWVFRIYTFQSLTWPPCPMSPLSSLPPLPPCSHCLHWKYYSIASVKIKSAKVDAHSLSAYWRNSTTVCITLYIHKCNALGMQPCKTFSEVFSFSGFYDLKSAMVIFKSILQYFCFT